MFESLRGRLQSDLLSMSFRKDFSLSSTAKDEMRHVLEMVVPSKSPSSLIKKTYDLEKDDAQLMAGAETIDYFQQCWTKIQIDTEKNSKQAFLVAREIDAAHSEVERLNSSVTNLQNNFDMVLADVEIELVSLEKELAKSVSLLSQFEDAIIGLNKISIKRQYQQQKDESLQKIDKLVRCRAEDLALYEASLSAKQAEQEQKILEERRMVFQQAFEEEFLSYKMNLDRNQRKNQTESIVNHHHSLKQGKHIDNEQQLENVTFDLNQNEAEELERFLLSDDV